MPERENQKYEIEFDEQGKILIKDPNLARLILEHAALYNGVEILVDSEPIPLLKVRCLNPIPPPPPPNYAGCPNGMCPMSINLRFRPAMEERWRDIEEDRGRPLGT